jgi:hypothetical protein
MATGSYSFAIGGATTPDGSASNLAPAMSRVKSSGSAPGAYFMQLAFDAGQTEWACWTFRMPANYASAPVAKIQFKMASATSGNVVWDVRVAAVTPGDSTDVDAKVFGSANTATQAVGGTAGYMTEASVTLTNADSVAAGDWVTIYVARAGADGSDTATGDAELCGLAITYTTT